MNEQPDDRVNLSALDPTRDRGHFDRVVGAVMAGVASELVRRRQQTGVIALLGRWHRPMLAAAAVALVVSVTALTRLGDSAPLEPEAGIAEAIGVPTQLADWVRDGELPPASVVLYAFSEGR